MEGQADPTAARSASVTFAGFAQADPCRRGDVSCLAEGQPQARGLMARLVAPELDIGLYLHQLTGK
jgi:hypothetical protein